MPNASALLGIPQRATSTRWSCTERSDSTLSGASFCRVGRAELHGSGAGEVRLGAGVLPLAVLPDISPRRRELCYRKILRWARFFDGYRPESGDQGRSSGHISPFWLPQDTLLPSI